MLMMRFPPCRASMNLAAANCLCSLAEGAFCIGLMGLILRYVTPSFYRRYLPSQGLLTLRLQALLTSAWISRR